MSDAMTSFLTQQLAYQSPVLLVCVVGFVLAGVWLRRHPAASVLAALGTGLLGLTAVAVSVVQAYLIQRRTDDNWTIEQYARWSSAVGIVGSAGRAVGLALLVAAVFVGRRAAPDRGRE